MKTFIVKILVTSIAKGYINGKIQQILASDVNRWKAGWLPGIKSEYYRIVKPMLEKAGWVFDPNLWQWSLNLPDYYTMDVWATIAFTGDGSESKEQFMKYVNDTGLLQYDHVVIKPYS